jgi:hypothetical protein
MPVLIQALLEHSSAQVVGLTLPDSCDGLAKLVIVDERLASRFGEPGGLEGPHSFVSTGH